VADVHQRLHIDGRTGLWLVGLWWGAFLATNIVERLARLAVGFFDPALEEATSVLLVAGTLRELFFLAAGGLVIWVVTEIEASQGERAAALGDVPAPASPMAAPAG
jgi:hypothetical protein